MIKYYISVVLLFSSIITAQEYYIVLKAIKHNMPCLAVIQADYLSYQQNIHLGAEHFTDDTDVWNRLIRYKHDCQSCCPLESDIDQTDEQGQVVHVCCSMILHGTCPHQGTIFLDPSLQYEDGVLISHDLLTEVNLDAIEPAELDDFAHMKHEFAMLNRFPDDTIPEHVLHREAPSWWYGQLQRVGIALLLKYVAIRAYVGDLIHKVCS